MPKDTGFFEDAFTAITGHDGHFPWQEELFGLLIRDQIPPLVSLPTGTGKTSVIPIWLIALAWQAMNLPIRIFPVALNS